MAFAMIVQRGLGDKQGADIIDPLINSVLVGLSRGQSEIDENGENLQQVVINTVFRSGVKLGHLAEVSDSLQGVTWRGKIIGISHVSRSGTLTTDLTIRRPA